MCGQVGGVVQLIVVMCNQYMKSVGGVENERKMDIQHNIFTCHNFVLPKKKKKKNVHLDFDADQARQLRST